MEKIIIMEEEEGKLTDTLVFRSLSSLFLKKLPNLTSFAHGDYSIGFPDLKVLEIGECPKMKAFSMGDYLLPNKGGEALAEEDAATASLSFFNQKATEGCLVKPAVKTS
ncbi:hypothetical protein CRG98_009705 [Punica granatum]|uniref:Uncharacterized protein n=1 Tax=Punica granatum TaxID=22663 RepID=A0A2I0KNC6_PUNGR|nr:hypothetical protein CRG98_009705 [Punica granatum]